MKEVDGDVLLNKQGGIHADCGHKPNQWDYFIRLRLQENDICFRYDVCSVECLKKVCRKKNLQVVELNGHGWVPASPHSRSRKHVGEITTL